MSIPDSAWGVSVADEANIDAYFERIGFAGSIAPSLETLGLLQLQHTLAIPFENLDPLMGRPVRLDLKDLEQKLLFDRRGGYCLEHNLLLKAVLESLDYEVKMHAARVLWADPSNTGEPTHVFLTADLAGGSYLVDAGFGGATPTAPLRLRNGAEQPTPHGVYRLTETDGRWQLDLQQGEAWRPLYSFTRDVAGPETIGEINERASTHGVLSEMLSVALVQRNGRLTLRGGEFITYRDGAEPLLRSVMSLAEMRDTLSGPFGIALPADERLDAALSRFLPGQS